MTVCYFCVCVCSLSKSKLLHCIRHLHFMFFSKRSKKNPEFIYAAKYLLNLSLNYHHHLMFPLRKADHGRWKIILTAVHILCYFCSHCAVCTHSLIRFQMPSFPFQAFCYQNSCMNLHKWNNVGTGPESEHHFIGLNLEQLLFSVGLFVFIPV